MSGNKNYFVIFGFLFRSRIRLFFNILNHDDVSELEELAGALEAEDATEDIIEVESNIMYESENDRGITKSLS